ncbi:(d)CMP kinase [Chryseobacterium sp. POL2]|uniref:(d)CMP kinase n=1 Tax=Chryseobacterium sp. POL2 TaxID=2713414 RepID=UPI0013E0FA79|nr:(d)CMP kinase [Chryseobacterium sp. POL2]QIG90713.1 (d)CMP kinase [Chryseobacterium sp. POL2]
MTKNWVIAIDGYSSTGKSSISKVIAKRLGLIHMDTGALYRGITYYGLMHCLDNNDNLDLQQLILSLPRINLVFEKKDDELQLILNGNNIDKEIRQPIVSENVSQVAKLPEVRAFLLDTQRNIAKTGGVIMDGRDIGTIVLPNADYKFFLTASPDERAKRRHLELLGFGENISIEEVKKNLIDRDKIDSERDVAPLKQAEDAILIDNSDLTKEQTIELIISYIK